MKLNIIIVLIIVCFCILFGLICALFTSGGGIFAYFKIKDDKYENQRRLIEENSLKDPYALDKQHSFADHPIFVVDSADFADTNTFSFVHHDLDPTKPHYMEDAKEYKSEESIVTKDNTESGEKTTN